MISFLLKYFSKLFYPIAWTVMLVILLTLPGNVLPQENGFKIPEFDKFVHICLFGGFVLLWCLRIHTRQSLHQKRLLYFFWIFFTGVIIGITSEYVQKYFIPYRDFSLGDIIADMIGCSIAYGISNTTLVVENDAH